MKEGDDARQDEITELRARVQGCVLILEGWLALNDSPTIRDVVKALRAAAGAS